MSLTVYIAHTGARLATDPKRFPTLEDLRSWISQKTSIDAPQQILMTARGKQVKLQSLLQEPEIFLYDRRILSPSSGTSTTSLTPTRQPADATEFCDPPQNSADGKDFQAWQVLFQDRQAWVSDLSHDAGRLAEKLRACDTEADVVQQSAAIAVENVKQHVGSLRPKFEESRAWAENVLQDQNYLLDNWDSHLRHFTLVSVVPELGRCLPGSQNARSARKKSTDSAHSPSLHDFVATAEVREASKTASNVSRTFAGRVGDLTNTFDDVAQDAFDVIDGFDQSMKLSDNDLSNQTGQLMEEIDVVAKKVGADYEHVHGLPNTPKSLNDISRTALLHARDFIPALQQTHAELDGLLRHAIERKNNVMSSAVSYLQRVSATESQIAKVHTQLANLDLDGNEGQAFDILSDLIRLPLTYGSLLVECIRRREWTEKMVADSSSLVEEVAVFKDEEAKRRKKWAKEMGDAVDVSSIDGMAIGIDINLQAEKHEWPEVSRKDATALVKALKSIIGFEDVARQVEESIKSLDAPTKQQTRRAKAFKNGSIHEASFGKQSLLLRRDDELIQTLHNDKSKLEDRLKGSDSRIRKLEDLLHRQTQTSRPPSSHAYTTNDVQAAHRYSSSPTANIVTGRPQDASSRRSSMSSRKIPNESEERILAQRIVDLEAELATLKREAVTKAKIDDDIRTQMQEAVSTKDDLMHNMEAQQREFDDERRFLKEGEDTLRFKLEEVEDAMDRMVESREQDDRAAVLEKELDIARKEAENDLQRAQQQADENLSMFKTQLQEAETLRKQIQELDDEVAGLSTRLQKRDMSAATNHRALRTVMFRLSKDSIAPEDLDSLVETVEELAKQSANHSVEIGKALETTRAYNVAQEARLIRQDEEIYDLKEQVGAKEMEIFSLREKIATQKTELARLGSELQAERDEHGQLRSKFAHGESSSESLRALLLEKDDAITVTTGKLSELETEKRLLQEEADQREEHHRSSQEALQARLGESHADSEARLGKQRASLESRLDEQRAGFEAMQADLDRRLEDRQRSGDDLKKVHDALKNALQGRAKRAEDVSSRLYTLRNSLGRLLEQVGFTVSKQDDTMVFQRTPKVTTASSMLNDPSSSMVRSVSAPFPSKSAFEDPYDPGLPHWTSPDDPGSEHEQFTAFLRDISSFNSSSFSEAITKRIKDAEHTARKYFKDARAYRDKYRRAQTEGHNKITVRGFQEGDLALFLPTRNHATKPWAAFNVGAPHCFLKEQEDHRLPGRDFFLARISKVEPRVVDLSHSMNALKPPSDGASDAAVSFDDENPFELSDGLRWNLIEATEEKMGPPMTIANVKSTVAAANVDATGSIRMKKSKDGNGATMTLTRSLDSRRSSSNSKVGVASAATPKVTTTTSLDDRLDEQQLDSELGRETQLAEPTQGPAEVRTDLLFGP